MRNPEDVLNSLNQHSKRRDYKYKRLYRNLYNQEMFFKAYQNIYANPGNMTAGINEKTIDGMSIERIERLIDSLKTEQYQPKPARRVYIPKKKGGKRLLGIPSFDDKLIQEVVRMLLESIYEDSFEPTSHGFRKGKSCHTALKDVHIRFTGCKWFIEGDIKGFFDNIHHDTMINILKIRIDDERFLRLIRKFLKAGYIEDWRFNKTYSGTPQGGIISPILANIYLDQFDKYINEYIKNFNRGESRKRNPEYRKIETQRGNLVKKIKTITNPEEKSALVAKIKELDKIKLDIPRNLPMDESYRRLQYVRYADDFLMGVIGDKKDCKNIKKDISQYLSDRLKLELSEEKTLITHATNKARFLGYDIYIRKSNLPKKDKMGRMVRNYGDRVVLKVPQGVVLNKLLESDAVKIIKHKGKHIWKPKARYYLKNNDDLEILETYNSEIRGLYNYYKLAHNCPSELHNYSYIMEYSMYKTYATKYRTTKGKIIDNNRIGKDFGIKFTTSKGERYRLFYNKGFKREKDYHNLNVDLLPNSSMYASSYNSLIDRLKANKCEWRGATDVPLEMHHVRKLKDLEGKKAWEIVMLSRRKTLAMCVECHKKLHAGKLD